MVTAATAPTTTYLKWEIGGDDDLGDVDFLVLRAPANIVNQLEPLARASQSYKDDNDLFRNKDKRGDYLAFPVYAQQSEKAFFALMSNPEARAILDAEFSQDETYKSFVKAEKAETAKKPPAATAAQVPASIAATIQTPPSISPDDVVVERMTKLLAKHIKTKDLGTPPSKERAAEIAKPLMDKALALAVERATSQKKFRE